MEHADVISGSFNEKRELSRWELAVFVSIQKLVGGFDDKVAQVAKNVHYLTTRLKLFSFIPLFSFVLSLISFLLFETE